MLVSLIGSLLTIVADDTVPTPPKKKQKVTPREPSTPAQKVTPAKVSFFYHSLPWLTPLQKKGTSTSLLLNFTHNWSGSSKKQTVDDVFDDEISKCPSLSRHLSDPPLPQLSRIPTTRVSSSLIQVQLLTLI